jgi:hypothetical protein
LHFRVIACTTSLVIALAAPAAAEDANDSQRAERLFVEASALMDDHQYAEACPKLAASQRFDPAIGTQFNLALCYERIGRLGSAWRNYADVERLSHAAGKTSREEAARQKLAELRPRTPHLVVTAADPDVTASVDGERVDRDSWTFYAVDAGAHTVEATAPAKKPWRVEVSVAASGAGAAVPVAVPPLETAAGETRIVTVHTSNPKRTVGFVLGAVGIVGLGTAALTGVFILNKKETADRKCTPTCVDQDSRDAVASLKTLLPINMVAWGIGVVGIAAGSFLILTSPSKPATASIAPSFDSHGGGASLLGRF